MIRHPRRILVLTSVMAVAFAAFAALALAQNLASSPSNGSGIALSTPPRRGQERAFEQYAAYWTTEPGWHTELQLRNNLDPGDLTVTPTLRSASGVETALPPVAIRSGDGSVAGPLGGSAQSRRRGPSTDTP